MIYARIISPKSDVAFKITIGSKFNSITFTNLVINLRENYTLPPKFGAIFNSTSKVSIFVMYPPNFQIFAIRTF
jgi:hypothetical protein